MASCQYVMAWVTALGVVMAVAQLYGYLFGQDQQTTLTIFAGVSVLVSLPPPRVRHHFR